MEEFNVQLVLLGNGECGKSTFISSLLQGLKASKSEDEAVVIARPGRKYLLRIQENTVESEPRPEATTVILLCYDISSRESLRMVQQYWHAELMRSLPARVDNLPMMLLGLKRDLRSKDPSIVDVYEAVKIGQEMRVAVYAECSAKSGDLMLQVAEDFLKLLRSAVDARKEGDAYSYCIVC